MDVAQALEDLLEELAAIQKEISKLPTKSVSGQALLKRVKDANKVWLPVQGVLESGSLIDPGQLQEVAESWKKLAKLADNPNPKAHYRPLIKSSLSISETEILHAFIKGSAIQTVGDNLRKLVQPISDPELLKYLDEVYSLRREELRACLSRARLVRGGVQNPHEADVPRHTHT
jgi:hypothetical protein